MAKLANVGLSAPTEKHDGIYTYFSKGDGLIIFQDRTWVLLISHSIHAEDGLSDLTLIRTSDDRYLVNRGHVCDKLILETPEKITSLKSFLKATGKGPKGEPVAWEPYTGE